MKIQMLVTAAVAALVLTPAMSADPVTDTEAPLSQTMSAPAMTYHRGEVLPVEFGVRDWKDSYITMDSRTSKISENFISCSIALFSKTNTL